MFEHERSCCLCMAFHADRILESGRLQTLLLEGSVRIVAITAAHQAFINLVMKRLGEVRLHVGMASVAERRLRGLEKVRIFLKGVNTVAVRAAHIGFAMSRTREVGM